MIISVPTLLARAHRRQAALPLCGIASLEVLQAVADGLAAAKAPGVLTLQLGRRPLSHDRSLIAAALWLAQHAAEEVGVLLDLTQADTRAWRAELDGLAGASVLLAAGTAPFAGLPSLQRVITLSEPGRLAEQLDGFQGLVLPSPGRTAEAVLRLEVAGKALRLPVVLEDDDLPGALLSRYVRSGVAGVLLGSQLEEAFLAGLRTGLRNRAARDTAQVFAPPAAAVADRLASYLTCLS